MKGNRCRTFHDFPELCEGLILSAREDLDAGLEIANLVQA